jgi:hypothetical protein
MARGWESKAVESQQEDARQGQGEARGAASPEALERATKRQVLLLARARTEGDLARATAPAQRTMLARALEDLDRAIGELG